MLRVLIMRSKSTRALPKELKAQLNGPSRLRTRDPPISSAGERRHWVVEIHLVQQISELSPELEAERFAKRDILQYGQIVRSPVLDRRKFRGLRSRNCPVRAKRTRCD